MDLSQYVKKIGNKVWNYGKGPALVDEKIIEKATIAELLTARDGKVQVFAVVTSIYNDEKDIGGGFFAKAYNTEHMLAKNFDTAKTEFDKLYTILRKEQREIPARHVNPDISKVDPKNTSNLAMAIFNLTVCGDLGGLEIFLKNGVEAMQYGDKIMLAMNSAYLPLDHMEYSDRHKALCWTYEDDVVNYVPIVLD